MPAQKPSVGRVVHYVARGSADGVFPPACRAATITDAGSWVEVETRGPIVGDDGVQRRELSQRWDASAVHLHVMNPTGTFTHGPMAYDPGDPARHVAGEPPSPLCTGLLHAPGSWHWPARV